MEYISLFFIVAILIIQIITILQNKRIDEQKFEDLLRKSTKDIIEQIVQENRALREGLENKIERLKDSQAQLLENNKESQQKAIRELSIDMSESLEKIRSNISQQQTSMTEKIGQSIESQNTKSNELKDSLIKTINEFKKTEQDTLNDFSKNIVETLEKIRNNVDEKLNRVIDSQIKKLSELTANNTISMDNIRNKLDERLDKIQIELKNTLRELQTSNEKKLEEMRGVVEEKLEKTLETRLQKSFETVSTQLESVNKGLGEMKTVAESVGSLNKMLNDSKSRGILGELQLGHIVEDMFPSQLYDKEVKIKKDSDKRVDYAIKLPGTEEGKHIYLPIDSKFPKEDYNNLIKGYESGDANLIESSRKALHNRIKTFAKDVKDKYISPPETTNFAIIFLPTEGLYAEIVRDVEFFDNLRADGIIIAGPTTLSAILSSFRIGFKTLQIQKGAADIEKILGAVKKEFENFEKTLNQAQKHITQAGQDIQDLVGKRTKAINNSLREVQTYKGDDTQKLLGINDNEYTD